MPASSEDVDRVGSGVVQLLAIGPGAGETKHECAATGFLINDEGYILTNAHVVEDARRCLASSPGAKILAKFGPGDGRTVEAVACDVIALDEDHDLAVLKMEGPPPGGSHGISLRLHRDPVLIGTRVWVTGHPSFRWQAKTYRGKVIARESVALGDKSSLRTEVLILDIPLQRGASGSPVVLESGEVIGVIERQRASNRLETVAVPISDAIDLFELKAVSWLPGHGDTPQ
jgi:serine protease Do